MVIPPSKEVLLGEAQKEVAEIEEQYTEGLITDGERYNKVVDIWAQVAEAIAKDMMKEISTDIFKDPEGGADKKAPSFNSIFIMADSGARGRSSRCGSSPVCVASWPSRPVKSSRRRSPRTSVRV
jgi:DNA-directed RNA polymerase subunit beta'